MRVLFFVFLLSPFISFGQDSVQTNFRLKRKLTSDDRMRLKKEAVLCFPIETSIFYSIDVGDVYPDKRFNIEEPVNMKRVNELEKEYQRNPNDFKICLSLGDVYKKLHKRDKANMVFERAESLAVGKLSKNPNDSIQFYNLGLCTLAQFKVWQKDFSGAEKDLNAALEIDPLTQDAFVGLAALEILKGNLKKAKDLLLKASSCGEENAKIKTLNGIVWMEVGDWIAAYQSFKAAAELDEGFEASKTILWAYFNEQ